MKTINELWKEVEPEVVPANASKDQRADMKRMFFVGFSAAYGTMVNDISTLDYEEAEKAMQSLRKQLQGFKEAIILGEA